MFACHKVRIYMLRWAAPTLQPLRLTGQRVEATAELRQDETQLILLMRTWQPLWSAARAILTAALSFITVVAAGLYKRSCRCRGGVWKASLHLLQLELLKLARTLLLPRLACDLQFHLPMLYTVLMVTSEQQCIARCQCVQGAFRYGG